MPQTTVEHTKSRSDELSRLLKQLTKKQVLIGIPADTPDRRPDVGETKQPPSNALIGYVMERGMPERNVPARPFLVPGVRKVRERIAQEMKKGAQELLVKHDPGVVDRTLNTVGLIGQRAAQSEISEAEFVPLAPATIKGRLRKGRTGTSPLIDTGQLRNALTYVVRDK